MRIKQWAKLTKIFFGLLIGIVLFSIAGCNNKNRIVLQGYVDGKYTYLASSVAGKLEQLFVKRGDRIEAAKIIFTLDPEPEISLLQKAEQSLAQSQQVLSDLEKGQRQTVVDSLKAQLQQAIADLDYNSKALARDKALYKERVLDKNTFDKATSDYDQSLNHVKDLQSRIEEANLGARENLISAQRANVAGNVADVNQMRWAVGQKTGRTPVAAQVFDTLHEVGEFVAAGQPVVVLLPPSTMKIVFFVPETILSRMSIGQNIEFGCDSCTKLYTATVNFVSTDAEFTPPVIFSRDTRDKLVYRIEAKIDESLAPQFHTGQPVDVYVNSQR